MRNFFACLMVWALMISVAPTNASAQQSDDESPGEIAREGIENLMRALGVFIDMIPQYDPPELNENGDIIIRRRNKPDRAPIEEPELDETRT